MAVPYAQLVVDVALEHVEPRTPRTAREIWDRQAQVVGYKHEAELIQCSGDTGAVYHAAHKGFFSLCKRAFDDHQTVCFRPDDVWLAILGNFARYVDANAEALRPRLVKHAGTVALVVEVDAQTPLDLDVPDLVLTMVDKQMREHLNPDVLDWLRPSFTTTTLTDQAAAAITIMGAMQKFFEYVAVTRCGLRGVTLLGTAADWLDICERVQRFADWELPESTVMQQWLKLLAPILDVFASMGAEGSDEDELRAFWKGMYSRYAGSGHDDVSGWLTAFAIFGPTGQWLGGRAGLDEAGYPTIPTSLLAHCAVLAPLTFVPLSQQKVALALWAGPLLIREDGDEVALEPAWCLAEALSKPVTRSLQY